MALMMMMMMNFGNLGDDDDDADDDEDDNSFRDVQQPRFVSKSCYNPGFEAAFMHGK